LDVRSQRFAGRAIPDTLRAAGITCTKSALFARHESGGELVHAKRKPFRTAGRSAFSLRAHYLSADRAPYRRGDVPFPEPSFRIAAGNVCGNLAGAGERTQDQQSRLRLDRELARWYRSARSR